MPDDRGPAGTAAVPAADLPAGQVAAAAVPAPRRRATLPPEVVASLRAAFAQEVLLRVPRLCRLQSSAPNPDVLTAALRDAHCLGSSAVVVGAVDAARCARGLESALGHCLLEPLAPLPPEVLAEAARLVALLDPWRRP